MYFEKFLLVTLLRQQACKRSNTVSFFRSRQAEKEDLPHPDVGRSQALRRHPDHPGSHRSGRCQGSHRRKARPDHRRHHRLPEVRQRKRLQWIRILQAPCK